MTDLLDNVDVVVQIDTREQVPLSIDAFPTERVGLPVGDYGIRGFSDWSNPRFVVERKSLDDLVGSLTAGHERFEKELHKMRQFGFKAIVIEATEDDVATAKYRSQVPPNAVLQQLASFQVRGNIHIIWAGNSFGAARDLERLVRQFARGIVKDFKRLEMKA